jgi:hypothetical protein
MAKRPASAHDKEELKTPSPSRRQGNVVSIKKNTKKPARQKAPKATMAAIGEPMVDGHSVNGDINARIAERAYELHHHRGGHHGQDLEDWLTAEQEVLSEASC